MHHICVTIRKQTEILEMLIASSFILFCISIEKKRLQYCNNKKILHLIATIQYKDLSTFSFYIIYIFIFMKEFKCRVHVTECSFISCLIAQKKTAALCAKIYVHMLINKATKKKTFNVSELLENSCCNGTINNKKKTLISTFFPWL